MIIAPDNNEQAKNILVVDDEPSIGEILSVYLSKKNFNVVYVLSGEEAIEIIKDNGTDLVLSDIKMPGIGGVGLLKWIRNFNPHMPVIMTTGFPTMDTAIEALKLGAFDYLTKPFHLEEIYEKINRALQARQLEEDNILFSKLVSLHEVTKVLASEHDIDSLNRKFLEYSIKISRSNGGALYALENGVLKLSQTSATPMDAPFWKHEFFHGCVQWVFGNNDPLVVETGHLLPGGLPSMPDTVHSIIVFPLRTAKSVIGFLALVRLKPAFAYSNAELEIINVLASQASISIENARLYQNIRNNYIKTVSGFALAVEAKDKYTHGHSENVMEYSIEVANHLGLSENEIEQIKYAGLLHDIGKIGVDERILNKPGKLNDDEYEQIKKHPALGSHIISNVPFFEPLVPLVRHHHEYFNGKGYPDGLAGEYIPFGARVLSVADAFEAMTSNRVYRSAMPYAKAFSILVSERNEQFDAEIVNAFVEVMQKRFKD